MESSVLSIELSSDHPQTAVAGGGKIQTKVNFLRLISDGDEEVNIRLYDGDVIVVRNQ